MMEVDALDENESYEDKEGRPKSGIHSSLLLDRQVLVVDEPGNRRIETLAIVAKIMPHATIETADSCEEAETRLDENRFDTFVVNLLMPGYSSSSFVKGIFNHDDHPLMVGFSADKMSDAYDPKKGIKIKPLRKLFELETLVEEGAPELSEEELEELDEIDDVDEEIDEEIER